MQSFEDLNNHIVYTKVKSRGEAVKLSDDAKEAAASGKSVVIFFENRYHLHLAPAQDPYRVRREIDTWVQKIEDIDKSSTENTDTKTTKTKSTRPRIF